MESLSTLNPLFKLGPFSKIMSYFDNAYKCSVLLKSLSTKTSKEIICKSLGNLLNKWENAIHEECTKITIYVRDVSLKVSLSLNYNLESILNL